MNKNFLFIALTIVQVSFAATEEDAATTPAPEPVNGHSLTAYIAGGASSDALVDYNATLTTTRAHNPERSLILHDYRRIAFVGPFLTLGARTVFGFNDVMGNIGTGIYYSAKHSLPWLLTTVFAPEHQWLCRGLLVYAAVKGYCEMNDPRGLELMARRQNQLNHHEPLERLSSVDARVRELTAAQDRTAAALEQGAHQILEGQRKLEQTMQQGAALVAATLEDRLAALNTRPTALAAQPQQPALPRTIHREQLALGAFAQPFSEITTALDVATSEHTTRTPSRSHPAATDTTVFTPAAASPSSAEASGTGLVLRSVTAGPTTFGPARPMQEQPTQETVV